MKLTLIIATIAISLQCEAQITVNHKPVTLVKINVNKSPVELQEQIIEKDTLFTLSFRDNNYQILTNAKVMKFNRAELQEFGKALNVSKASTLGDETNGKDYMIKKNKVFVTWGSTIYQLYYDHGFCNLSTKDVDKMIDAIAKT